MGKVTEVIESTSSDDAGRLKALWDAAYDDLRVLARSRLRRSGPMTLLDTTSLVNEAFVRLSNSSGANLRADTRKQFYAYASQVMRSIVVDLARERATAMRGGDGTRVTLDSGVAGAAPDDDPLKVHEALESLGQIEPRLVQVVEMRYFAGLTEAEIGEVLEISASTIRRDWEKARALLRTMLSD